MLKHLLHYLMFAFTMFAAGAPAVAGGQGGQADSGGQSGQGAGDGGRPSGSPADSGGQGGGAGTGQGAGAPGEAGLRELRQAYEGVKAKFEPFEKLGLTPDQVTQYRQGYEQVYSEAAELASNLGYEEQDFLETIQERGLLPVLDFLRNQSFRTEQARAGDQQAQQEVNLRQQIEDGISQAMGPIEQRENVRLTDTANATFETTVRQLAVDSFKAEGLDVANIPAEELDFLMTATSEVMKYDEGALKSLKYEGKTAGIQKAFQEARTALDKYYLARSQRERNRLAPPNRGGQPQSQQQQGQKKHTLDELIENPALINAKYS